ncbi:MAG: DNA primase [Candidatus Kerfeldbacteria bacterium]|nr:DNA primase [Candidatus Kerfeldbacteria bacterium]
MTSTEEIKQRIDIVELIQGYIHLTPAGANWKARCPFHNEKTASFMVSRDKGIWHCFGCGKGGDAFTFVQEIEGMEFPEALELLATKAGVEVRREDPTARSKRQRALDINALSMRVYHKILLNHEKAKTARDYLERRGVTADALDTFQLGYAPESWEGVSNYLKSKGFADEEIFLAGLTVRRDRGVGYYDRFRHRIMFPVHDHLGRVVGFGGRAIDEDQQPKYVNTPQTFLYNKSAVLYGLHRAKTSIKEHRCAVVVEGYMDVIASHQAGVTNVVASSGTAFTHDQLALLKRFTTTLVLAFDTDMAGEAASMRSIQLAWEQEFTVKVVILPSGKDPDELVRRDPKAWKKTVDGAVPFMEYLFHRAERRFNLSEVEDKKAMARMLLPVIGMVSDPIEQTHYLQRLGGALKVSEEVLRSRLPKTGVTATLKHVPSSPRSAPKSREQRVAEQLLAIASQHQEHLEYLLDHLEPEYLAATNVLGLYKAMVTYYTENRTLDQQRFLQLCGREDPKLAQTANIIFLLGTSDLLPQDEKLRKQEVLDGVAVLKRSFLQAELSRLQTELAAAEQSGHADDARTLTARVAEIARQLAEE